MTMTLDDVRNLDPDEITAVDRQVLVEHKDELTEDEQLRYKSFIEEKPKEEEDPTVEKVDEVVEEKKEDNVEKPVEKEDEPVVEEKFSKTDVQQMINEAVSKITPVATKEEKKEVKEELKKFVPDDWEPNSWSEVLDKAVEYVTLKNTQVTQQARTEIDQINDALTAEVDDLRSSGEPIPAKNTKEYAELDKELTSISLKYNLSSFKHAYDIYKQIQPKEAPVVEKKEEPVVEKKDVAKDNKVVAKQIGGAKSEVGKIAPDKSYKTIQGKTPRQMVSQFIDELE